MVEKLRLESPSRIYGVENGSPCLHSETIGALHFKETFVERNDIDTSCSLGDYTVVIETTASTFDDLGEKTQLAKEAAELLDKIWIYAAAYPITITDFSKFKMSIINPIPSDWTSNYDEVENSVSENETRFVGKASVFDGESWMIFDTFPLETACKALNKYEHLSEAETYLIDLHHLYLTTEHRPRPVFLLAKALEIVESIVSGITRQEKSKYMDELLGRKLSLSLDELLRISNTSREIRHVVRKKSVDPELHPNIGQKMITEFAHNANIIIRCIMCNRMDIPFNFVDRE